MMKLKIFLLAAIFQAGALFAYAAEPTSYKESKEYLTLRDAMHHSFNDGDSAKFFIDIQNLENYLQKQGDLHAYYTQRCNEIVFLLNRQNIVEAYKLALQLSKELTDKRLDKEMYMAVNMMGHINNYCGNHETATKYFEEVLERMEKEGYQESMPPIIMNMVNIEMERRPEKAVQLLDKAVEIAKTYSPERVFDIETRRTLSYYSTGQYDKFLEGYEAYQKGIEEGKTSVHGRSLDIYKEALSGNTDKAVQLALEELGSTDRYSTAASILAKAGRWQDAYNALEKSIQATDSVNNAVLSNSMQGIEEQMRTYEKEKNEDQNRFITMSVIMILLLLLVAALVYIVLSRRSHIKELRRAYNQAMESDKMKSEFIRNVSHEVRTPLNIITGFAQIISDPNQDASVEERQDMAKTMTTNAALVSTLIDEMLVLSLNDTSTNMAERNDNVRVNQTIKEILDAQRDALKKNIEIRMESKLSDDQKIKTNIDMFRHIINATLDNAVKFTEHGHVTVRLTGQNGHLQIAVEDTGCGIKAGEQEHIFERFYKIDPFKQGIGLGLPLSRKLSERLGGDIKLDTAYTDGARFVIDLPM